jgi:predicted ATPase
MREHLIVKSFGPISELDIRFEKITIIIGDQGTGKSCIAKLFSMFKWLEKALLMGRCDTKYYSNYSRFKEKLCAFHRINNFFRDDSYILCETQYYTFEYKEGKFNTIEKETATFKGLAKIIYIPAERCYLSSAESGIKKTLGLPESCSTFNQVFTDAKLAYKQGFDLPFGNLHFEYHSLNETSYITGTGYKIKLSDSSSGIQSALPMCLVSTFLSKMVSSGTEREQTEEEKEKTRKEIKNIMDNDDYADVVKEELLKRISSKNRYRNFINIAEEPELNMFPNTQLAVMRSLIKANNMQDENMLVVTTHSPYMLAIVNMLTLASEVSSFGDMWAKEVEQIEPMDCLVPLGSLAVYELGNNVSGQYCKNIVDEGTKMITVNELDCASEIISSEFNKLYQLHGNAVRKGK